VEEKKEKKKKIELGIGRFTIKKKLRFT